MAEKENLLVKQENLIQWCALVTFAVGNGPNDALAWIITRTRQVHLLARRARISRSGTLGFLRYSYAIQWIFLVVVESHPTYEAR